MSGQDLTRVNVKIYYGESCEKDLNPCNKNNQCIKNSTCKLIKINSTYYDFKCICSSDLYYGVHCENKINVCKGIICSFNGRCQDIDDKPKCKCFTGYSGDNCEIISEDLKYKKTLDIKKRIQM